jgi:hypothetical protein
MAKVMTLPVIDGPSRFFDMDDTSNHQHPPIIRTAPRPRTPSRKLMLTETPSSGKSRKRKATEQLVKEPTYIDPPGQTLTEEERNLRIDEANILFPKYMAKHNAKRAKQAESKRQSSNPLLFLPNSEYHTLWDPDINRCQPNLSIKEREKTVSYFKADCRNPGEPIARNIPCEMESNPLYYDLEWNQKLHPRAYQVITPPEKGSLPNLPTPGKKVKNPVDRVTMDSFILALKEQMGDNYFDINELQYFPRSDGRVELLNTEKSRRWKQMKNGIYDVTHFLRNRQLDRCLEMIKEIFQIIKLPWNDEIAETFERKLVHFVDPLTVAKGRSYFLEQDEYGIQDPGYLPAEPMAKEVYEPPAGMSEEGLGRDFYWSEHAGRMVSVNEMRENRDGIEKLDQEKQKAVVLGTETKSKSRSACKQTRYV